MLKVKINMFVVEGKTELGPFGTMVLVSKEIVKNSEEAGKHIAKVMSTMPINTGSWEITVKNYVEKKVKEERPTDDVSISQADILEMKEKLARLTAAQVAPTKSPVESYPPSKGDAKSVKQ